MATNRETDRRQWTLSSARALFPDVRARTEGAVGRVEALLARRGRAKRTEELQRVDAAVNAEMQRWQREMEALGVEVKGPWLVDFDTGSGYLCWRWPEDDLSFFHTYEAGFAGRTRIQ